MKKTPKRADTPKTPKAQLPVASPPPASGIGSTTHTPEFSPKILKQITTDIYEKEIKPYVEAANENKRKFSEVSTASEERIKSATSSKRYKDDKDAWAGFISGENRKKLTAYIDAQEAVLQSVNQLINVLVEQFAAGTLVLSSHEKNEELRRLEEFAVHIQSNLVVLRTQMNQVTGEWTDEMGHLQRQQKSDWAYIDLLISRYRTPKGARLSLFKKRDADVQERFRAKVFKAYDSIQKGVYQKLFWCCISGTWTELDDTDSKVRAAHIVPYNIGELNASYLFGPPPDGVEHLMNPRNGLPMKALYEEHMDDGSFVLVPVANSDDIKVVVLKRGIDSDLAAINGKILSFPNDFRPAKRYLYFAFVMTLLRRQRHDVPGWWRSCMEYGMQQIWATPGEYLRHSTLKVMARRIAHMSSNEAVTFISMSGGNPGYTHAHPSLVPQSDDQDYLCTDSVSVSLASKRASTVDHLEDDDDDDDNENENDDDDDDNENENENDDDDDDNENENEDNPFLDKGKGKAKVPSVINNEFAALMQDDGDDDDGEDD
jgi:hypothetical protein